MKINTDYLIPLMWAVAGFYLIMSKEYLPLLMFLIGVIALLQAVGVLLVLWNEQVEKKMQEKDEQLWKLYNDKDND